MIILYGSRENFPFVTARNLQNLAWPQDFEQAKLEALKIDETERRLEKIFKLAPHRSAWAGFVRFNFYLIEDLLIDD